MKPILLEWDEERELLGRVILDCHLLAKTGTLLPEYFTSPEWGQIFSRLRFLYNSGVIYSPAEAAVHCHELECLRAFKLDEVRKFFFNMAQICSPWLSSFDSLVRTIRYRGVKAKLDELLQTSKSRLATIETQAVIEELNAELDLINFGEDSEKIASTKSILGEISADLAERPKIYPTGIASLDEVMGGGLFAGKCYGIPARKKSGKTSLMATIAQNLNVAGTQTIYFALEMGRKEIMHRVISRSIGENPISFLTERRNHKTFQDKVENFNAGNPDNLYFVDKAGISFTELKRELFLAIRKTKAKVVIIDYWQLISGKNAKQSTAEHLDEIAQWLAEFAKRYQVAVVMPSQINQQGNTRGSEGLKLAFDMILQIHRDDSASTDGIPKFWIEMTDSRYTTYQDIGSEMTPKFRINPKGVHFEEINYQEAA